MPTALVTDKATVDHETEEIPPTRRPVRPWKRRMIRKTERT